MTLIRERNFEYVPSHMLTMSDPVAYWRRGLLNCDVIKTC